MIPVDAQALRTDLRGRLGIPSLETQGRDGHRGLGGLAPPALTGLVQPRGGPLVGQEIAPMAWIIGGLAIQMLTMKTVGFSLSTGLLFAATARGFGYRKFWISVPVGIVFAFVIWFIFARGLQLSLPSGWLEQFV